MKKVTIDKKYKKKYFTIAIAVKRRSRFMTVFLVEKLNDWLINAITIDKHSGVIVEDVGISKKRVRTYYEWLERLGYKVIKRTRFTVNNKKVTITI